VKSYVTSYNGLFTRGAPDAPVVDRIEIPLIQRDYAQGRQGEAVKRIRAGFLDVLHAAVTGGDRVGLDFVYGDVESGTMRPLDGQQRLTTLFLLHWYLGFRAGRLLLAQGSKRFSYATRASARLFCERLSECQPPMDVDDLSAWIVDQAWYLHTWNNDPTVQSMLVMVAAIHERFRNDNCGAAWERLTDAAHPAISFHFLAMEGHEGRSEDLYIKMNSRGKPLTAFENFKARFEQVLEASCPDRVAEFALKVDGEWSDLLWPYRGDDDIVDDEFLRYFHFVTEVNEWRQGRLASGDVSMLAEHVYGRGNAKAATPLDFMFRALDTWVGADVATVFGELFARERDALASGNTSHVVIFGQQSAAYVDLFEACCRSYGESSGKHRVFTLQETLLLYAVLLHRLDATPEFARRLRALRNLIEASRNEVRLERMPLLIADVARIIVDGTLDGVTSFNQAQAAEERTKRELLAKSPELERAIFQLEDHAVLRGSLAALELDVEPAVFERRAAAFHRLFSDGACWPTLTGALLATGDYSRRLGRDPFQLGAGSNAAPWRDLFTGAARTNLTQTRTALADLLDRVAEHEGVVGTFLEDIQERWLSAQEAFDWRHYFVRYPAMREGRSGLYVSATDGLGYDVVMLDMTRLYSWYRDPYLLAILRESGVGSAVEDPWFMFDAIRPRWMNLVKSGVALRSVDEGIALRPPGLEHAEAFARVCAQHSVSDDHVLRVEQAERDGRRVDTRDRVLLGAALLRDLVNAGL